MRSGMAAGHHRPHGTLLTPTPLWVDCEPNAPAGTALPAKRTPRRATSAEGGESRGEPCGSPGPLVVDAPELREARICDGSCRDSARGAVNAEPHRVRTLPCRGPSSISAHADPLCGFPAMSAAPPPMHPRARATTIEATSEGDERDESRRDHDHRDPDRRAGDLAEAGREHPQRPRHRRPPVVDEKQHVLGVVSEADIIVKASREAQPEGLPRIFHRTSATATKRAAHTAAQAMTSPAITVTASRRVDFAAALMLDKRVNRLPVVDDDGVLVGIVTRADLVGPSSTPTRRSRRRSAKRFSCASCGCARRTSS